MCQRGELASDRASDADMRSSIIEAMSRHENDNVGEITTESCLQMMRSEISFAAVQHRNLVEQMTASPRSPSSSADVSDNNSIDTRSGSSKTLSVSSSSSD